MNPLHKFLEATWLKFIWSIKGELTLLVLAISLFFNLTGWLRAIDATAAPLDPGILMAPALALIGVLVGLVLFWIIIKAIAPVVDRWFDGEKSKDPEGSKFISFELDWLRASPAVRLTLFVVLLVAVLLTTALITLAVR